MRAYKQGFGVRFQAAASLLWLAGTLGTWTPGAMAQSAAASPQVAPGKVLNFSNWADYLPEGFLEEFEAKSGIKVRLRTYQSYEALQRRMEGNTDIDDLVVPSLSYAKAHLSKGLYQPLDKRLLTNLRNLDPELLKVMARVDPGNRHFVPYAWGYSTVFINRTRVMKALAGGPAAKGQAAMPPLSFPANEWDLVFNPVYTQRLKGCGIAMLESPRDVMASALLYLGQEPFSQRPEDYRLAADMLSKVRPDIRTFTNQMYDLLPKGDICVALAWSGDIHLVIDLLKESLPNEVFEGLQPSLGATRFIDVLAIPAKARNTANAHAFINFYLEALQGAKMPSEMGYPSGNLEAMNHVDPGLKTLPLVFPGPAFVQRLHGPQAYSSAANWAMMQAFMSFAFRFKLDNK